VEQVDGHWPHRASAYTRGIRLTPAPGAAQALIQLIDLERECCAWIDFEIGAGSVVMLTAAGDGEAALAGMFAEPA
jgi:hypothetical protein